MRRVLRIWLDQRTRLIREARRHGPGTDWVADIVQDTLMKVLSGEIEFEGVEATDRTVLSWLLKVNRNVARNRRRYEAIRTHEHLASLETGGNGLGAGVSDEAGAEWGCYEALRFHNDLAHALHGLPDAEMAVAELLLLEEYTLARSRKPWADRSRP